MKLSKAQFNLQFLAALDFINARLKHASSGSNGRHPNLRLTLLRSARGDLELFGLDYTVEKYRHFISSHSVRYVEPD